METKKANKNPILSFFAIVLVVAISTLIGAQLIENRSASLVGSKASAIQIDEWTTPQPSRQSDLDGKMYVLEFWAIWCEPCVRSIPCLIELTDKYKDKAIPFIAISVDNSSEPVKTMVKSKGINYYVGMDNNLAKKYSRTIIF